MIKDQDGDFWCFNDFFDEVGEIFFDKDHAKETLQFILDESFDDTKVEFIELTIKKIEPKIPSLKRKRLRNLRLKIKRRLFDSPYG